MPRPNVGPVDISPFAPEDIVALRAAYDIQRAAMLEGREDAPHWSWQEMSAAFLHPDSGEENHHYLGRVEGRAVAYGVVEFPTRDNLDKGWLGVAVLPQAQHAGYGRAMLEHLENELRGFGRTVWLTEATLPFEHVTDHRIRRFAEAADYDLSNVEIRRNLDLPVRTSDLDRWEAEAAGPAAGYRIVTFGAGQEVDDELIPSLCVLLGQLAVDAPTGEADWEEEVYTPERYREMAASLAAGGRRMYETVAIAPDGTVAAQTTLSVPAEGRHDVAQWGTFVHREHRGKRLGLAVKVANLRAVQEAHPDMRRVSTQNAETNDQMVAINELMGFEPVEASVEFIKRV